MELTPSEPGGNSQGHTFRPFANENQLKPNDKNKKGRQLGSRPAETEKPTATAESQKSDLKVGAATNQHHKPTHFNHLWRKAREHKGVKGTNFQGLRAGRRHRRSAHEGRPSTGAAAWGPPSAPGSGRVPPPARSKLPAGGSNRKTLSWKASGKASKIKRIGNPLGSWNAKREEGKSGAFRGLWNYWTNGRRLEGLKL